MLFLRNFNSHMPEGLEGAEWRSQDPIDFETSLDERETNERLIADENFSLWKETLLTLDPKKMAELYAESATFLPTVSPEFKKGKEEAEGYFEHFLEKHPTGEIVKDEVQPLGPDCYLHSGLYDFEVGPEDNRQKVEARFSFIWKKDADGNWKILHHHSSVKPQA